MGELEKGRLRHARVEARSAFQEDRGTYDRLRHTSSLTLRANFEKRYERALLFRKFGTKKKFKAVKKIDPGDEQGSTTRPRRLEFIYTRGIRRVIGWRMVGAVVLPHRDNRAEVGSESQLVPGNADR